MRNDACDYDVAIIGGGPAGLSAALVLGRACRSVAVFDHGQPRNIAATAIHGFLGHDGIPPLTLREIGRREASRYNVTFFDCEAVGGEHEDSQDASPRCFRIDTAKSSYRVRAVLLATGMVDQLPDVPGLRERYGTSVHHCPYCDGWEHRGQHLVALGANAAAAALAATLRGWSRQVSMCTNGQSLVQDDRELLNHLQIPFHEGTIRRLAGSQGGAQSILFCDGTTIPFDGIFFSSGQEQRSKLPKLLGCDCNNEDLVVTAKKQTTNVGNVFLAGDADGDVQFSVVAAAEGAIAATAIHQALLNRDQRRCY